MSRHPTFWIRFRKRRNAWSMIELLASGVILSSLIGTTATLTLRLRQLDEDSHDRLIAIHEVANVLEEKAGLLRQDANVELPESFAPSEIILHRWPQAMFQLSRSSDPHFGNRITLSLQLTEQVDATPIQLSSWVNVSSRSTP